MKKIFALLMVALFARTLYAAETDWEQKVNGEQHLLSEKECQELKNALTRTDMPGVREKLFGTSVDYTIPDWIVYVDENGKAVSELLVDDKDDRGNKYPYIKDKNYIYTFFITSNKNYWENNEIYVNLDSLQKEESTGQQAVNLAIKILTGKEGLEKADSESTSSSAKIKLSWLDMNKTMKFGNAKRFKLCNNSENQLRIHLYNKEEVPEAKGNTTGQQAVNLNIKVLTEKEGRKKAEHESAASNAEITVSGLRVNLYHEEEAPEAKGNTHAAAIDESKVWSKVVFYKFGVRSGWGSRFSASIAPISLCENPWNASYHLKDLDFRQLNFKSSEIDIMFHFYPLSDQYPFKNGLDWRSINVFIGTPIVGGQNDKTANVVNFGVGCSNFFGQNIGLVLGSGINYAFPTRLNWLMGLDFKII